MTTSPLHPGRLRHSGLYIRQAGYEEVEKFLRSKSFVSTIQLGEVNYILLQEEGREEAQSALVTLKNTEVDIVFGG